jgi:hypothetical protein
VERNPKLRQSATAAERTRVGLRFWPDRDELKMHIDDPGESRLGCDSETFGKMAAEKFSVRRWSGRRYRRSSS